MCLNVLRQDSSRIIKRIEPVKSKSDGTYSYVVTYEDGWDLFSTDKRMPPIMANSDHGTFVLNSQNQGLIDWMNKLESLTNLVKNEATLDVNNHTEAWMGYPLMNPAKEQKPNKNQKNGPETIWTKFKTEYIYDNINQTLIGPLVETEWGMYSPWNIKLWNPYESIYHATGCVATSIAQLLYYYHYKIGVPSGLYHDVTINDWICYNYINNPMPYYNTSLTKSNFQNPSSDWDLMIKKASDYSPSDSASVVGANLVSSLMVDIGNRANMQYWADGIKSGSTSNAVSVLNSYGLSSNHTDFSDTLALNNINNQQPFFILGYHQNGSGHAWVVDGYRESGYTKKTYTVWVLGYLEVNNPGDEYATEDEAMAAAHAAGFEKPEDGMVTIEYYNYPPYSKKFHMNWGYDGESNGFYTNSENVTINNISYNLTYNQKITQNIHANE